MSINLVDLIMKQVGGNLPGVLGSLLGESADRTQGALAGAVPAVLGGLMGVASKGGAGANQLAAAIGDQDDSMLDDLAGMLGGGNHNALADQGSGLLSSLLGEGVVGNLVGAIGKFSGLGSGSSKSLLGMLAPIVMSVIGRQQKSAGLDASGLMGMLADQKDHISAAMPSGLSNVLGASGLMDSLMGSAGDAVSSIGNAASGAANAATGAVGGAVSAAGGAVGSAAGSVASVAGEGAGAAGRAASSVARGASDAASQAGAAASGAAAAGGSWLRWALPFLILLGIIWLAFKFLSGGSVDETVSDVSDATSSAVEATTEAASGAADAVSETASSAVEATTEAASGAADAVSETASSTVEATTEAASGAASAVSETASSAGGALMAMVGDVDVGGELTSMFDGLGQTLGGITDVSSAEAALPALEETSTGLDSLTGLADQLPTGALGGLSEMVGSGLGDVDGMMETLNEIPGVSDVIEPVMTQIKDKLAAFVTG